MNGQGHLLGFAVASLVVFYLVESWWGPRAGAGASMVLAVGELLLTRRTTGRFSPMSVGFCLLVGALGLLTILGDDPRWSLLTPAIGDGVFGAGLIGSWAVGRPALREAMLAQDPDLADDPALVTFLGGMTLRLGLGLLAHGAVVLWTVEQSRELWLFWSGPGAWIWTGTQIGAEVLYARWRL